MPALPRLVSPFSVDHLDVFDRPGATVKRREGRAGCWVKFENGWTVSIQWDAGNYSSNYDRDIDLRGEIKEAKTGDHFVLVFPKRDGKHEIATRDVPPAPEAGA